MVIKLVTFFFSDETHLKNVRRRKYELLAVQRQQWKKRMPAGHGGAGQDSVWAATHMWPPHHICSSHPLTLRVKSAGGNALRFVIFEHQNLMTKCSTQEQLLTFHHNTIQV